MRAFLLVMLLLSTPAGTSGDQVKIIEGSPTEINIPIINSTIFTVRNVREGGNAEIYHSIFYFHVEELIGIWLNVTEVRYNNTVRTLPWFNLFFDVVMAENIIGSPLKDMLERGHYNQTQVNSYIPDSMKDIGKNYKILILVSAKKPIDGSYLLGNWSITLQWRFLLESDVDSYTPPEPEKPYTIPVWRRAQFWVPIGLSSV